MYDPSLDMAESISFEAFVAWLFDREPGDWDRMWSQTDEPIGSAAKPLWSANASMLIEHVIRLHESPLAIFAPFTNEQMGKALWSLYDPNSPSPVACPTNAPECTIAQCVRLIAAMPGFIRSVAAPRISPSGFDADPLYIALYMFWDLIGMGGSLTAEENELIDGAATAEMLLCMHIDHPTAIAHAIHGFDECLWDHRLRDIGKAAIQHWLKVSGSGAPQRLRHLAESALSDPPCH
jgi:hypothetical protein